MFNSQAWLTIKQGWRERKEHTSTTLANKNVLLMGMEEGDGYKNKGKDEHR